MAAPPGQPDQREHRARLRERFAVDDGVAMPDYELLELILFSAIPRRGLDAAQRLDSAALL